MVTTAALHERLNAFLEAVKRGDFEAVRHSAEADPEVVDARTPSGERAIHAAHYFGHPEIRDYLFAHGAVRDFFADVELGDLEAVRARLEADPDSINTVRPANSTLLHVASHWGYPAIVALLIEHGADVDAATTVQGFHPLHSATAAPAPYAPGDDESVVLELVDLLLDAGADVNARSVRGLTPLVNAAANGDLRVVQRLIERGADPTLAGYPDAAPEANAGQPVISLANKTALDFAVERGRTSVVEYLKALPATS